MENPSFLADSGDTEHAFTTAMTHGASAQGLSANFDKDTWETIEKKLSSTEIDVLKVLVDNAFGVDSRVSHPIYSISDTFYQKFRKELKLFLKRTKTSAPILLSLVLGEIDPTPVNQVVQTGKIKKEKKVKPLSKIEQIRQANSLDRIDKSVKTILTTFKTDFTNITSVSITASMNSDVLEIKGIGLLYACAWLDYHVAVFNTEENYAKVFDIIATVQKFINRCNNPEMQCISQVSGDSIQPSSTLIIDLERWVVRLRSKFVKNDECVFNWKNIQQFSPQIFVQSEYQKALPQRHIKSKDHQKQIIDAVRKNIENGALIVYDAMIGSGKTTSQVGIAALISYLRSSNPSLHSKKRFLSVCNSEAVRLDVAQKMYNAATTFPSNKLHFAISYITQDSLKQPVVKIVKNNACKQNSDIVSVIASPAAAKMILEDNDKLDIDDPNKYEYILFVDEPTMGADNLTSRSLYDNVFINHVSPYITINSSATFPEIEMLSNITTDFFSRHKLAKYVRVYSDEISIGCDIRTLSNEIVVPHLGATTNEQLVKIIDCVKTCSFLGKAYTPNVVNSLYEKILQYCDNLEVPDINTLFSNVDNLNINCVRKIALELLTLLSTQSDHIIQIVCATTISSDDEEETDDVPNSFSFSTNLCDDDLVTSQIDYTKLATTQAYRLQGQTLIATTNPEEFVINNFKSLIDQVYNSETCKIASGGDLVTHKYKSTGDAMKKYSAGLSEWEKKFATIEKNAISPEDKIAKFADHEKNKPIFNFPEWAHVGSEEHLKKFSRSHKDKIVRNLMRSKLNVPHLTNSDNIINVDDRILTSLFCGIAIYSTETVKCRVYLDTVLQLASIGALAFVVADSTICFGTNYPFFNVIITEEFSKLHSMLVLFQVMGRAGRPGKSPKALIIVPNIVANRIINFVTTASEADIEARNMETMFIRQKVEIEEYEDRQIEARIAKATPKITNSAKKLTIIHNFKPTELQSVVVKDIQEKSVVKKHVPQQLIVPISSVPEANLSDQRQTQSFNRSSRDTNSAGEWKRNFVPNQHRDEIANGSKGKYINTNGTQSSTKSGKYIPPAMREDTEKKPRYKETNSKFGEKNPSSSGWKKI